MGLTGDFAGLRKLQRKLTGLARGGAEQKQVLGGIRGEVRGLLKEQFAQGIGPDGAKLQPTARGKAALVSRKLPGAFQSRIDRGILRFTGKTKRDLLSALDEGHVWTVGQHQKFMTFDRRGRLVRNDKILNKKTGKQKRGYYQRFSAAHERVLPARPIRPVGELPTRYQAAIGRAMASSLERWGRGAGGR